MADNVIMEVTLFIVARLLFVYTVFIDSQEALATLLLKVGRLGPSLGLDYHPVSAR